MEAINTTFQHLENISTTTRKGKKDVEEAVTHLSSIARLLELPSASGNTFARLSEILRGRLLPLYRASLSLALDYAVAVFSFIHNNKLTPLSKSGNPQHSWENLLISLLSGILDFLDENSNNKNRESVAFALYPALCSFYFLQPAGPSLIFSGELLSVVYQVLIATADCHAQNAGKLRDYDVGSARLGLTISQTKDFLALESLLDLLGSLIPPLKGGRDKRTQFIKEVFDPSIFKYTSDPILGYLESISSPDWSVTSEKIIKVLAEYDISFPQPFEASSLVLNGLPIDSSSPVYVDKLQFIANLDKDGKIETLHIPFSTVLHILIFASADQEILVVVKILKPPMLGNEPISVSSDEEISVSWKIKKSHMNNFGRALKSRNLTIGHPASRKLSKVKAIELDFDSSKQDSLILTQERLQKVSQAWATSPKRAGEAETSPLALQFVRTSASGLNIDNITSAAHEPILPSWDTAPSTIFLGPDGTFGLSPNSMQSNLPGKTNTNVLNDSKDSDHALPPDTHHPSNYENGGQIGTDERQFHPRSRPTTRSKKRIVEVSDDDEVEALLDKSPIRASTIDALPASRLKSDSLLPMTQMTQKGRPSTRSTKALPAKARTEVKPKPKQGIDHNRLEKPIPDLDGPQQMKKRPVQEIEAKDTELYTDEGRPAKRIRSEAPSHSPVPPVPMRSYQRKKYGRKGLQSSPVALVSPSIYFDEVPKPKPQNKLETKVPNVSTKPRASAMKGKNGNSVPKTKPASAKKQDVEAHRVNLVKNDPNETLLNTSDIPINAPSEDLKVEPQNGKANRRSARVASLRPPKKDPTRSRVDKHLPKKSEKAPWEEIDFLKKSEQSSDPMVLSDPVQDLPVMQGLSSDYSIVSVEDIQPHILAANSGESSYAERYTEFIQPTKGQTTSTDRELSEPAQEIIMIDLTHDDSPLSARKARKVSKNPTLPILKTPSLVAPTEHERVPQGRSDIALTFSTALPDEDKTLSSWSPKKPKIERISSPTPPVVQEPDAKQPSVRFRQNPKLPMTGIEKITSPLQQVEGNRKERLVVNFTLPHLGPSQQASNKIHLHATMSPKTVDQERHRARDRPQFRGAGNSWGPSTRRQEQYKKTPRGLESDEPPMQKIIETVRQITEAVIHNIEHRFDKVTEGLHVGQRIILEGTANSLQEMYRESVLYFNDMVDLEEEYALHCAKIATGMHDYIKSSEQLSRCFKDIAIDHSRKSLSKRFPATLFPRIPALISNPSLRL